MRLHLHLHVNGDGNEESVKAKSHHQVLLYWGNVCLPRSTYLTVSTALRETAQGAYIRRRLCDDPDTERWSTTIFIPCHYDSPTIWSSSRYQTTTATIGLFGRQSSHRTLVLLREATNSWIFNRWISSKQKNEHGATDASASIREWESE